MRNIIAILALFVCTSICLGAGTREIPAPPPDLGVVCSWNDALDGAWQDDVYNCAANSGPVFVFTVDDDGRRVSPLPMSLWIAPVDCILNITTVESKNARIGAYACGARMSSNDRNFKDRSGQPKIQGPMTGNGINVCTGWFYNSTLSGAYSVDIIAAVDNNRVTITNIQGGNIGWVYGGRAADTSASSNTVTIAGVDIGNNNLENDNKARDINENKGGGVVYGGYVHDNGVASNNEVKIDKTVRNARDVFVGGTVYGGYVGGNGTVTINKVNLTSVTVTQDVFGAFVVDGDAKDNRVTIKGGKVEWRVYGGAVGSGTATLNKVNLTSVTVTNNVIGGMILEDGYASSNTVTIISGAVKNVYGGYVLGKGTATLNEVHLTSVTVSSDVYGAWVKNGLAEDNKVRIDGNGEIIGTVFGGYIEEKGTATLNKVNLTSATVIGDVFGARIETDGLASSNTVTIKGGEIEGEVYGGYIQRDGIISSNTVTLTSGAIHVVLGGYIEGKGTATINTVNLTSVTTSNNVFGASIGSGLASSNTVIIKDGKIEGEVYGGYIYLKGTATLSKVNLTSVTISNNVFGAWIVKDGLASSNTVIITSGTVGLEVYGGYIDQKGTATGNTVTINGGKITGNVYGGYVSTGTVSSNTVTINGGKIEGSVFGGVVSTGTASSNTVTINGGKTGGNVFGGYVKGNGKATHNTITITGSVEFSTATILCGGICANTSTADASTNDAFTGNTLNIVETKGVVVNGISNFENYNFHLKDIKHGETILTATSGGCSWDVVKVGSTTACTVDLSRSNIHLRTQSVLNKGEYCTLIKSPQGFKDNGAHKQFSFDNGGLVEYSWEIKIAGNGQDLIATLKRKELREGKAKPLLEGNVTGMVCINNGMDCIISKMEETESLLGEGAKLQRKGEIGAFYGLLANKSSYDDTGSHIDMTGMSMMGGIGIGWKGLVTGAFGEYGTGNSNIDSGLCPCKKKSEGTSNYVGGGLLGRYNVCEDEFRGTKLYLEAILRAGEVSNSFNSKEAKDGAEKECKYNDEPAMYGGCALGGGYKHKVGEKIDVDWSLRYMFGYQDGKDIEKPVDADGNRVKLESVKSSRIRIGVRGKYVELEKVKPYIGIWYEHELSGEVKGAIQNGVDNVGDIPATSFEGGTGIGELGVSVKVGKVDVGISGQGYLGVRKGFGGMLKLKYAFGKDTHAKPPKPQLKD